MRRPSICWPTGVYMWYQRAILFSGETKYRLKVRNSRCYSVQTLLSSQRFSKLKLVKQLYLCRLLYRSLLTIRDSIHEGINCTLKAENSCFYPVQTLLHFFRNLKIKIYKIIILPVVGLPHCSILSNRNCIDEGIICRLKARN